MTTLASFKNVVRWENDSASFRKVKKELEDFKKGMKQPFKDVDKNGKKSVSYRNAEYNTQRGLDKLREKDLKREQSLYNIKQKQLKSEQAIQAARIKQSVGGLVGKGTPDKAKDTVLASMLKGELQLEKQVTKEKERQAKLQTSLQASRIKQTVSGMTSSSGAGKASKSALADQLRQEVKQESKIETILNKQMFHERGITDENRKRFKQDLKSAKTQQEFLQRSRHIHKQVRDTNRQERERLNTLKKQNFAVQRMNSSTKQFVGNMVSAFAAVGAGSYILQTGGAFESVNSTMLAVSKDSKEAGENLSYVREEARRLGLSLVESSKGFAKLTAARGEISLEDTKELFSGVSEMSTLLGLTTVESGRALTAIQQMASKGKISAEELRLQLGEVLPNAIQLMAKSTQDAGLSVNGTVAEMSKLMEGGQLLSHQVLPFFAKNMRNAANANGALDTALDKNLNPALGRTLLTLQDLSNEVFKGLKPSVMFSLDAFNELGEGTRSLAQGIGSALGGALMVITTPIKLVTSLFLDLRYVIKETFDITDEAETRFMKLAGTILGVATALALVAKWSKLAGKGLDLGMKVLGGGKSAAKTGAKAATMTTQAGPTAGAYSVGKTTSGLSQVGRFSGITSALVGAYEIYDRLSTTESRNKNVIGALNSGTAMDDFGKFPVLSKFFNEGVKVNLEVKGTDGLIDVIETKANSAAERNTGNLLDNVYMNLNTK